MSGNIQQIKKSASIFSQERGKRILLPFYLFRKHPADILICMWFYTVRDLRSLLSFPETTSTVNNMWFLWLREIRTLFPFLHVWKHPADQIKRIYSSQWFVEIRTLCLFFGFPEMISGKIDQMTGLWTMSQLGWMNQNEPARAHEFWCALKCGASCCEGVYSLKGKLRITHVMAVIAQMFGFKVPWECRLRDTMPSKAVSRKHARSRVWKMILSWLSASVDDALVALNFSVATLFAVYIGIRCGSKQAVRRGSNCSTPLWHWGGEILDFATCCRNTDTHDVLKEDPITGFIDAYWRFDVRNGWQTVPIRTAACCGSSDTGGKITTEIRR